MEKVLNQAEIDAMVRAARGGETRAATGPTVTPWDVRGAGQIGGEQMNSINLLHEEFARNLTFSLGAYLRIVFEVALVSAEHLPYREFLQRLPESTYLASYKVSPADVASTLQIDLSVAFPIIDLLLGGEGRGAALTRDITEIEEQILESVVRVVLRELQSTWQAVAAEFRFDQRQLPSQAQRLMPPDEKTLCLSFEITMPETRGTMNLAVPAVVSNALLRKITADCSYQKPRGREESRRRMQQAMLDAPLVLDLRSPESSVFLSELAALTRGTLLVLPQKADRVMVLTADGVELFRGAIARVGQQRALRVAEKGGLSAERKAKP